MKNRTSSLSVLVCIILCYYCSLLSARTQTTDPLEVYVLKQIKGRLGDPYGNLKNWGKGDPCMVPWTGVLCQPAKDGYFHLERVQLFNMNLTGNLAPEIGILQNLTILDFMWNDISGSIPKEIGNMTSLQLLLLNGNQLSGPLPEELGNLSHLIRLQIDQNKISGSIPKSFANLTMALHIHMNNNSLSGQIPEELYKLPKLIHLLVDNNNLTGELPPELANIPKLEVLQLDNNPFINSVIPVPYANMKHLVKLISSKLLLAVFARQRYILKVQAAYNTLEASKPTLLWFGSLRNCSLHGLVPDFSTIPALSYLDLSYNGLTGNISAHKLSSNITTIDLSHNKLKGPIPSSFAGLPLLQKLLLNNNNLTGFAPSDNGSSISFNSTRTLLLDFRNNNVTDITRLEEKSPNIILWLDGNPVCSQVRIYDISKLCSTENGSEDACGSSNNNNTTCSLHSCSSPYYGPNSNSHCFSAPVEVGYRLKSPSFSFFSPYIKMFGEYLTSELNLDLHQLSIVSYSWSPGPRLDMNLKIFPPKDSSGRELNESTILQIQNKFTAWQFTKNDILGPYEYLSLTTYNDHESGLSKGALAGILIGTIFGTAVVTSIIVMMILKRQAKYSEVAARKKFLAKKRVKVAGVKDFDFEEMALATNNFSDSMQIGQGGYGRVYKGLLNDGTVVAIKRAREGSLQGEKEFSTEIELLSRLHHRNLVSLLGYCDDQEEQMLVYEYMGNGTLRDHLCGNFQFKPLDFALRLRIALGSAKGILYLHNEANPPIFHRDIKASNILLDNKFNARVADFGLSKLASLPDMEGSALDHVSTVVKGTPGYLDPEYFLTHQLTDKSDVYSFGVVLLELLTGMEPISHGKNIVREVNMAYQCGNMLSMIDKRMGSYPSECLEPFASLALRCCKDETDARPAIAEVVQVLEKIVQLMPPGTDISSTPSIQSHIYPMDIERTSTDKSAENPYISSDITGSDLLSGNIPGVAPR